MALIPGSTMESGSIVGCIVTVLTTCETTSPDYFIQNAWTANSANFATLNNGIGENLATASQLADPLF